jgi:integrase/recombinase XerD
MKAVAAPKFQTPPVEPYTKEEIEALLKACEYCKEAQTTDRRKFTMRRATHHRDRAIILILLDTGLRASELCALRVEDADLKTGKITVRHEVGGGTKGKKGRTVYLGKVGRKAVWRYLANREDGEDPEAPLFLGKFNRPFNKDALRQLINALGQKANVKHTYPHRFRHTFGRSLGRLVTAS